MYQKVIHFLLNEKNLKDGLILVFGTVTSA